MKTYFKVRKIVINFLKAIEFIANFLIPLLLYLTTFLLKVHAILNPISIYFFILFFFSYFNMYQNFIKEKQNMKYFYDAFANCITELIRITFGTSVFED